MAENETPASERTEAASPRRREEAFRRGQIPRSVELTTAAMILGATLTFTVLGPALGRTLLATLRQGLLLAGTQELTEGTAVAMLRHYGLQVATSAVAFLAALAGVALAIGAAQARGVLTGKPLEPDWSRLNPITNAKRLLSVRALTDLVKALGKLSIIGFAVYRALRLAWRDLLVVGQQGPASLAHLITSYSIKVFLTAGLAYLALAAIDYAYQWWTHEKSMRMTKAEVKREMKQTEGDPMIKARMKGIARKRIQDQMLAQVPKADVVITNPTHIAVAIQYNPAVAHAPVILAMGDRRLAVKIKAIAMAAGIPIVENKPVARALFASAKVGQVIPEEVFLAVAEILAFVADTRAEYRARWRQILGD